MFINLPTSFPENKFKEFGRLASKLFPGFLDNEDDPHKLRSQFVQSWKAVAYRYRTCAKHNEEFKTLLLDASDLEKNWGGEEQNYELERCLYGFFMNSLSIFESFGFCLYFVGASLQFMKFLYVCEPRNINLEETIKAFRAAFSNPSIANRLEALTQEKDFISIKDFRNILAHRLAGKHYIFIDGVGPLDGKSTYTRKEGIYIPGSSDELIFDDETTQRFEEMTQRFLDEITSLLTFLLEASIEFVQESKPEKAFGKN